jgi:hypothetical protein
MTGGNPSSLPLIATSQATGLAQGVGHKRRLDGFQISSYCPELKDWNEDLVQRARSFLEVKQSTSLKL